MMPPHYCFIGGSRRAASVVEAKMVLILVGALLLITGVMFIVLQPLKGRLSRLRSVGPTPQSKTLEPERPGRGMGIGSNWPGLLMIGLGSILMLAWAAG
jgi:hypothetical protein